MRIVINDILPAKGFKAITLWPFIFARKPIYGEDLRHELIHGAQQKETLVLGFYIVYGLMWVVEFIRCLFDKSRGTRADGKHRPTWKRAYKMIPYEREAFYGEIVPDYLQTRKLFNFIHFIK